MRTRTIATVLATLATAATVTAATAPAASAHDDLRVTALVSSFDTDARSGKAVTYDQELVPPGSVTGVGLTTSTHGTTTELKVSGLVPHREYGAHVHVDPCGPEGADAGPHYQHRPDPVQPSTDPAFANPDNEIWLDFTTDASGKASARSEVDWRLDDTEPRSVVIHEHHTATGEGEAGTAGDRLACLSVAF